MTFLNSMGGNRNLSTVSNSILLIVVFVTIFIVPVSPVEYHKFFFNLLYSVIFFVAILALERYRRTMLILAISAVILEWLSSELHFIIISAISKGLNIIFFMIVVIFLILQIARTKKVTARIILESINGYLLMGMVFSLVIAGIMLIHPEAYTFPPRDVGLNQDVSYFSDYLYYGFVTFTTLGYGDITPVIPFAKSLAILCSVTGQIYVAVIIAMLVGKFSSTKNSDNED